MTLRLPLLSPYLVNSREQTKVGLFTSIVSTDIPLPKNQIDLVRINKHLQTRIKKQSKQYCLKKINIQHLRALEIFVKSILQRVF